MKQATEQVGFEPMASPKTCHGFNSNRSMIGLESRYYDFTSVKHYCLSKMYTSTIIIYSVNYLVGGEDRTGDDGEGL